MTGAVRRGPAQTWFEDVEVGDVFLTPAMTITEAHVSLYRGLTFDEGVEPSAVPELLPLCLSIGLGWRIDRPPLAVIAFLSFDWEVLKPLRVGDTIHCISRTASRRAMREGGILVEDHEIVDHRGQVAQRGRFTFLVARRPQPAAPPGGETPP